MGHQKRTIVALGIVLFFAMMIAGCTQEEQMGRAQNAIEPSGTPLAAEPVTLDPAGSGTMSIPWVNPGELRETHVKHHWDMKEGKVKVEAQLQWDDTNWEFKLTVGTGDCPHSGEALAETSGDSGNLTVVYEAAANETFPTGQWFAHIETMDESSHRGESCAYQLSVTLYHPTEESEGNSTTEEPPSR